MRISDWSSDVCSSDLNGKGATTEDYNTGKAMIGTGPYKFVEWVKGDRIVLEANPDYWGGKPQWDRVEFKPISSGPARVADRKSVVEGKSVDVRVELGGRGNVKKKKDT